MIKRKNFADEIAEILQRKIFEMNLKEGDRLPSHEELAQDLGVSKASLREGLQKLSTMGVIDLKQGLGTIVATPQISNYLKILSPRLITKGSTLTELFEGRKCIESTTVSNAAMKADERDIRNLRGLLSEMEKALQDEDTETFLRRDVEFHNCIAQAGKNEVLEEILNVINELLLFHENLTQRMPGGIKKAYDFHKRIFNAIKEKNAPLARQIMEEHIDDVKSQRMVDLIIYCDTLGTGSIGGTFFSVGRALSKVINRYSWIKAKTEPTGGGIENVILAGEKRIVLGITQSDVALHAFLGSREFSERYDNIRAVCGAHHLDMQIFTFTRSKITSIRDLKGKKVALGAPGGASRWVSHVILDYYGFNDRDILAQYLPFSNAVDALKDERIDAVFYLSGGPSSALLELSEKEEISFLPIEKGMLNQIIETFHYWTFSEIVADTYIGQKQDIPTLGVPCILITHKDVGEEAIYSIVKSILEHTDEITEEHPAGEEYSLKNALRGITIPVHPGAKRYFLENKISYKHFFDIKEITPPPLSTFKMPCKEIAS
ncbi:MAG: TAXI family TRAP transporter solute-binding subunit [Deltaproteobacteria bacterium]|nr:TAXI family TRAP transporter solute-binding subunit [Deltaproteobacteria bacterium]